MASPLSPLVLLALLLLLLRTLLAQEASSTTGTAAGIGFAFDTTPPMLQPGTGTSSLAPIASSSTTTRSATIITPLPSPLLLPSSQLANANATTADQLLNLKVGLLFANATQRLRYLFGFGQSAPAITIALRRIRQEGLINNVNFSFSWMMTDCDQARSTGYPTQMILDTKVDAIIGPPCVTSALIAGYAASYYNTPIYVWGATVSSDLSNTTLYPSMSNMNVNTYTLSMAIKSVLNEFQWKEIALVYCPDNERRVCGYFQQDFEQVIMQAMVAGQADFTITFKQQVSNNNDSYRQMMLQLSQRARIVVSCFDNETDRRNFLLFVKDAGYFKSNEYMFIFGQLRSQGFLQQVLTGSAVTYQNLWVDKNDPKDGRDDEAKAVARQVLVLDLQSQSQSDVQAFSSQLVNEFGKAPFYCNGTCLGNQSEWNLSVYSRSLHDTMYLYALALNKSLRANGPSMGLIRNGSYMRSFSKGQFTGATGDVKLNDQGNREPVFYLTAMDANDVPTIFMSISVTASNIVTVSKQYSDESATIWASRNNKRPSYKPLCGYTGSECPQSVLLYALIGGSCILLLFLMALAGIGYAIRERMREQERLTRECIIPYMELKNLKEMRSAEQLKELDQGKSMRSMQSGQSGSTGKLTMDSNKQLETDAYAFFVHNKEVVFGTKYTARVRLVNEDLVHIRKLRQMDHDNLNKFVGICTDAPIFYAVWKWCQRGSLKDLIAKEQYVTDSFVMFALMRDITNGLIALHSSFISTHGFLSSENCLINDRWQVRISDYGLNMIRESQPIVNKKKLLWTAPELLREMNRAGTKEGDVYSFGIVCTELVNRETVWNGAERDDDVDEIIYRLKRTNSAIPHRPQLHAREEVSPNLLHLIRDCWAERPSERPKMELVRTMLKQMVRDGNQNLMDYVFGMLEQYASSLEQEVDERTKELVEEKRKSDILLYRMLPRQVADKLKLGESVEPESFALATILFSDVVSFTTLASKCTPLQVVNLLNNLYTTFDNIIDLSDAYKVETIGDGYLVCSGIPKRNGDQHVREIAELSFAFLRAVVNFRVDHLPAERMNLRIGFHTGPAVAGVVGLTMPRYCLFGDSVNTASRMESNGKPGHIHISSVSNQYLTNVIGGYLTEPRGEVIIKGKGVMDTFWLLGRDPNPAAGPPTTSGPMYNSYVNGSM